MDAPIENSQETPSTEFLAETNLPSEVFSDPDFLKDISFLEDVQESFTSLSIAAAQRSSGARSYGDPINDYNLNTLGYRSSEIRRVPVVFAGCSVTFGVGVPYEGIWSTIVGEKLGLDYINLSAPGWSIQAIIDNLFKYFYAYGNPEAVFVALPEYNRLVLTSNHDFCRVSGYDKNPPLVRVEHSMLPKTLVRDRPKYSKKPYEFTDFITPEYALSQAFRSINSLISYCKGSNIKLVWSTWDNETNEIIKIVRNRFNNTSYSNYVFADCSVFSGYYDRNRTIEKDYSGCHADYANQYGETFFRGQDRGKDESNHYSHPGIHYHIHLAEAMLEKFESIK
jgi:hypothetical protein